MSLNIANEKRPKKWNSFPKFTLVNTESTCSRFKTQMRCPDCPDILSKVLYITLHFCDLLSQSLEEPGFLAPNSPVCGAIHGLESKRVFGTPGRVATLRAVGTISAWGLQGKHIRPIMLPMP